MSRREHVLATLREVTEAVSGLPLPAMRRLMPVLSQAQSELQRSLFAFVKLHNASDTFTAQRYRNALVGIQTAMKRVGELAPTLTVGLGEANQAAGRMALGHLTMELTRFSTWFEGTVFPVSIDVAALLAQGDHVLIKQFASSAKRYAGWVGETIVNELAVSRVRAETMFELTDRLQKRLPLVFKEQRNRAWMVARTETMEAYNLHHYNGLLDVQRNDDPSIVARWDSSYDGRRCPMCASLDGQVVDPAKGEQFVARWTTFSKKGPRYHEKRLQRPTAHPFCRCVITPWREEWARYLRPTNPSTQWIEADGRIRLAA